MNPADLTITAVLIALAIGLTLTAWLRRQAEADLPAEADDGAENNAPPASAWKRNMALGMLALAATGAGAWKLGYADHLLDTSHGAIEVCESLVQGQLRSPSTYKRIAASYTPAGALTRGEYERYRRFSFCPIGTVWAPCEESNRFTLFLDAKVLLDRQGIKEPTRKQTAKALKDNMDTSYLNYTRRPAEKQQTAFVQIDYDAANAYGTPIRSLQICRFGPRTGEKFDRRDMFGDEGEPAE